MAQASLDETLTAEQRAFSDAIFELASHHRKIEKLAAPLTDKQKRQARAHAQKRIRDELVLGR